MGSDADSTKPPAFGGYGFDPAIAVTGGCRMKRTKLDVLKENEDPFKPGAPVDVERCEEGAKSRVVAPCEGSRPEDVSPGVPMAAH